MKKLALAIALATVAAVSAYASQSFAGEQQADAQMIASVPTDADASNGAGDFLSVLESKVGISHAEPLGATSTDDKAGTSRAGLSNVALNNASDERSMSVGFAHAGSASVSVGVSQGDASSIGSQRSSSHGRASQHAEGATMTRCITKAGAGVEEKVCEHKTISMEEAESYFAAHATN